MVLETPQYPSHVGGNHPRLCTKEKHLLDNVFEENMDTYGLAPSLIRILYITLQTA